MEKRPEMQKETKPGTKAVIAKKTRSWRGVGVIFLCFVAGAIGSAVVLLAQGDLQRTVNTNNTREVVSLEGELVAEIAKQAGKSTVSINTQSVTSGNTIGGAAVQEGAATGIIVSSDGYVLTNRHVIPEGISAVEVVLSDGTKYENVRVVGRDSINDIAFLKIEGGKNLTPASIGDSSKMQVGQKVIAVGNALGQFQNTVTTGVLSGIGRPIVAGGGSGVGDPQLLENLFQTDAAINPGNSGGPLLNLDGEVIGINTAVAEGAQGIGFAIPINDAKGLIASVTQKGKLIRPFLGVRSVTLTPDVAGELGIENREGAYVVENGVVDGSPAAQAGVQPGDIIIRVNDKAISETTSLSGAIAGLSPGQTVTLTIVRDGREQRLTATLKEFPDNL